ncbi:FAD-binding oxidoreductase [Streptomyces sp. NPDC023588]|uniref:FAD-binding oxidoreductase n=1 Tax=Streptomyces sp. NPDC023588 TaxID=3154907 RepID=UPI0033C9E97A
MKDGGCNYRARLASVHLPSDIEELRALVLGARRDGRRVVVCGAGRSQGGLTLADHAIQIDTSRLTRVEDIDSRAMTVRVQSGVTWDRLRGVLDPLGLSTRCNQSYGVFTVGGSVSVNAHGRNVDTGVLAETIVAVRVMLATGEIVQAGREENRELFGLVVGGLGLIGVLVDVTLRLTRNDEYEKSRVVVMPVTEYPRYVAEQVRSDRDVHFHYARLSVADDELWQRLFCVDYRLRPGGETADAFRAEPLDRAAMAKQRMLLWGVRRSSWVRRQRFGWELQYRSHPERVRRNNVAKESIRAIQSSARHRADWLQEFFVPAPALLDFLGAALQVLREEQFRLLNTTLRFVPRNEDALLSYARQDSFSAVLCFEQALEPRQIRRTEHVLRRLLDCALDVGGAHYLCYQRFASTEQLQLAYPGLTDFFDLKNKWGPDGLFTNQFHQQYGSGATVPAPAPAPASPLPLP